MWRRWTTEWTLACGEHALSLRRSGAKSAEPPVTVWHDDTPSAFADALTQALDQARSLDPDARHTRRVRVLLEDRWMVWMSLQGAFWAVRAAERDALARTHLAQQLGADPSAWRVCSDVPDDGQGLIACAVSESRGSAVMSALQAAGLQPVSVRPNWVDRLERLAPSGLDGLVARRQGDLLCLALRQHDRWVRVSSLLVDRDAPWAPRAIGWAHALARSSEPLARWFDGAAPECPPGWTLLEAS